MLAFARMLGIVGTAAACIPAVIGAIRLSRRPSHEVTLWAWVALIALLNVVTTVTSIAGYRTIALVNYSIPVFVVVGMHALGWMTRSKAGRWFCWLAAAGYLALWLWQQTVPRSEYAYVLGPAASALLCIGATVMIESRLRALEGRPFRDPGIVAGLAVLVTYAPLAALEAVSPSLATSNLDLLQLLWLARIVLMILGSILFTLAFRWTIPPRPSPGSLSSPVSPPAH